MVINISNSRICIDGIQFSKGVISKNESAHLTFQTDTHSETDLRDSYPIYMRIGFLWVEEG